MIWYCIILFHICLKISSITRPAQSTTEINNIHIRYSNREHIYKARNFSSAKRTMSQKCFVVSKGSSWWLSPEINKTQTKYINYNYSFTVTAYNVCAHWIQYKVKWVDHWCNGLMIWHYCVYNKARSELPTSSLPLPLPHSFSLVILSLCLHRSPSFSHSWERKKWVRSIGRKINNVSLSLSNSIFVCTLTRSYWLFYRGYMSKTEREVGEGGERVIVK